MKRFITSIWFLAFVLIVPVFFVSLSFFQKYTIKELSTRRNTFLGIPSVYFEDLNGDGEKEIIKGYENQSGNISEHSIQYFNYQGAIYDQLSMFGSYHKGCRLLAFGDINKNGLKEIYGFSMKKDSLMLTIFEPFNPNWIDCSIFIAKINPNPFNFYDPEVLEYLFCDYNQDGVDDLLVNVGAGYSLLPRSIYMMDGKTFEISHTPIGGNKNSNLQIVKSSGERKPMLIADGQASYNMPDSMNDIIGDKQPYLKFFNVDLSFKVDPIAFPRGIGGTIRTIPVEQDGKMFFYTFFNSPSIESPDPTLYKIDENGVKLDSICFAVAQRNWNQVFAKIGEDKFCIMCEKGVLRIVDLELSLVRQKRISNKNELELSAVCDLNDDGATEFIFRDLEEQNTIVYTENFRRNYIIDNHLQFQKNIMAGEGVFYGSDNVRTYLYKFEKNSFRVLIIPYLLAIYLFLIGIMWIIRKGQEIRLRETYELQTKLSEIQLAAFRTQLHPHFIFNTFNGIMSVALQGRRDEAYDLFTKFTKVLRATLQNTESIMVTLADEMMLVQNFLDIQQFRFQNLFKYEIDISDEIEVENVLIPKMIIQIHVENAIKHGIKPMGANGWIRIKIHRLSKYIINIIIEDNGVGREKAKILETSGTGLGIKTINQFIQQVNDQKMLFVEQKIIDLYGNDGLPLGTRIDISINRRRKNEPIQNYFN